MTIAAGFVCSDGIVLASDTLFSNTGQGNKFGRKFWALNHGDVVVCFGGAGTEAGLLRARDEIDRKLKPGMSRIRVIDTIDDALKKVAQKLQDDPTLKTQALVVVRINQESVLYENAGGTNMLSPVQQPCQCVGYAQSLGWYFASSSFREGMSTKWAKIVAAHLVQNVKQYSEYCGGDTHLLEVPTSGIPSFIDDQQEIAALADYLGRFDVAMRAVLPDGLVDDQTLTHRLDVLTMMIQVVSRSVIIPDAGSRVLLGSPDVKVTAAIEAARLVEKGNDVLDVPETGGDTSRHGGGDT